MQSSPRTINVVGAINPVRALLIGAMGTTCDPVVVVEHRKPQPYTPSPWGDFFLSHQPCTPSQLLSMKERARVKEEEVKQIVRDTFASSSDMALKLELVDTLQRIGVGYHYGEEIDDLLRAVHRDVQALHQEGGCDDDGLYVTSLRFYLLRKHGYRVSSDVFVKFKDEQGNFASTDDASCFLMLYDAAHLRTRGEEILDSAIAFTKIRLQSVMDSLEPELAREVQCTLETPRYRRVERVEARRYISVYERKAAPSRNDTILEFAKLDYNILQALYCEELKALTIWWKDLRSRADLRFARERVVEMYFWMLGVVHEPQYSYSRILLTKFFKLVSLIDDFCDSYSTTEESEEFTMAIEKLALTLILETACAMHKKLTIILTHLHLLLQIDGRWNEEVAEQFPAYMKALYINIHDNINESSMS
ncbi:hypothetical protein SEVIR_9G408600v4 [Setaria viridis]